MHTQVAKAISLLEIVAVLAIISIMVGLGTYGYGVAQRSARDEERKIFVGEIRSAVDHFYLVNRDYPEVGAGFMISGDGETLTIGTKSLSSKGFRKWQDVTDANQTNYFYAVDGRGYVICGQLESGDWFRLGDGGSTCM